MRKIFAEHGVCAELVSDNGPQFTAGEFKNFLKCNGINHVLSAPYHPSTNGQAERFVGTFKKAFRKGMRERAERPTSLNHKLCEFLLAYRTTPHTTTKRTPAEMLGRRLKTRLDLVHPDASERIQRQSSGNIRTKPTRELSVGDSVLTKDYRHRTSTWITGVVTERLSPCSYHVTVGDLVWKRHIDQLRPIDGSLLKDNKGETDMDMSTLTDSSISPFACIRPNGVISEGVGPTGEVMVNVDSTPRNDATPSLSSDAGSSMPELRRSTRTRKATEFYGHG